MAEDQNQATQLHQQASAHYLQGEFQQALDSWRELLTLDPHDERALEGVRLCELLADDPPPPTVAETEEMDEVDAALEFQSPPTPVAAPVAEELAGEFQFDLADLGSEPGDGADAPEIPNPERQADGIDFGDVAEVQTIGLAAPQPAVQAAVATAPATAPSGTYEPTAVTDLAQKTTELYAEATSAYSGGDSAQALAVLSRLFVLDETNAQGHALEQRIRAEMEPVAVPPTSAVQPGISQQPPPIPGAAPELDLDGFDLDSAPGAAPVAEAPPEAPVAEARPPGMTDSSTPLDENSQPVSAEQPGEEALALDLGGLSDGDSQLPQAEAPTAPEARPASRRPAPQAPTGKSMKSSGLSGTSRNVAIGVVLIAVLGIAVFFVLQGSGGEAESAAETGPVAAAGTAATESEAPEPAGEAEAPEAAVPELVLPDRPVAEWMQEAEAAMAEERFDDAVLAFHAVLKADPGNVPVREQARIAADLYKKQQEETLRWSEARQHFEGGRYEQALKLFYRLPDDGSGVLQGYQFNGWYNMGRQALTSGDCLRARKHFREANSIRPDVEAVASALALCETCRLQDKPASYYQDVRTLQPRTLEQ